MNREQFSFSGIQLPKEVNEFLDNLSKKKRLTSMIHKWAVREMLEQGLDVPSGVIPATTGKNDLVLKEIREIKELLLHRSISSLPIDYAQDMSPIQQVSTEKVNRIINSEDLIYKF
jgi:hypothetical protein